MQFLSSAMRSLSPSILGKHQVKTQTAQPMTLEQLLKMYGIDMPSLSQLNKSINLNGAPSPYNTENN